MKKFCICILTIVASILLTTCDIFLSPDPFPAPLQAKLEWVKPTDGVVLDVSPSYVFSFGNIEIQSNNGFRIESQLFVKAFTLTGEKTSRGNIVISGQQGAIRQAQTDDQPNSYGWTALSDRPTQDGLVSIVLGSANILTNAYSRYNSYDLVNGHPITTYDIGPKITRGPQYIDHYGSITRSSWMVGTFTDKFQAGNDIPIPIPYPQNINDFFTRTCRTFGKADCFIILLKEQTGTSTRIAEQWGGSENDIAYDVVSDAIGNPTIFLRAGTDFGITSATQSIVRMKTGYNVVKLDTNGLLISTFPVRLEANAEIGDVQFAWGRNNNFFLLARDEQRKQYFLMKGSPNGTLWTRYFDPKISIRYSYTLYRALPPRMGMTLDSKENVYLTGSIYGTVNFGGTILQTGEDKDEVFLAKYSSTNTCLGAITMGKGRGINIRLSSDETSVFINGWANGEPIMGAGSPSPNDKLFNGDAFLAKVKVK